MQMLKEVTNVILGVIVDCHEIISKYVFFNICKDICMLFVHCIEKQIVSIFHLSPNTLL